MAQKNTVGAGVGADIDALIELNASEEVSFELILGQMGLNISTVAGLDDQGFLKKVFTAPSMTHLTILLDRSLRLFRCP